MFAEIGVAKAITTTWILDNFDIKMYYAIDPYIVYDEYNESYIRNVWNYEPEPFYQNTKKKLEKYNNVKLIREFSHKAIQYVNDNELDVCYIDGNHAYEYVLRDLECWLPKVKPNGILCGDDTFNSSVSAALNYFFSDKKYDVFIGRRSWFMKKWDIEIYW